MPVHAPDLDWTVERALALPEDGNRYEVLDGELFVTPSPSTARADRHRKRVIYQSEGVPEYWIFDGDARIVERWRSGDDRPEIISSELTWQPLRAPSPFQLPIEAFFDKAAE